jgi:hypothetical protein
MDDNKLIDNTQEENKTEIVENPAPKDTETPQEAKFVKSMAGWATFKAIIDLLQGGMIGASVFGIIIFGAIMSFSKGITSEFASGFSDIEGMEAFEGMDFLGEMLSGLSIIAIVAGIIMAAYAVFKILAGIRLLKAVDKIKEYLRYNMFDRLYAFMYELTKHFKYTGISLIIYIGSMIIGIAAYVLFIINLVGAMGNMF